MLSLSVLFAINHTPLLYLVGGSTLFRPPFLYFRTLCFPRSFRSPLLFSSLLILLLKVLRCFNSLCSAFYSPICFPLLVSLLPALCPLFSYGPYPHSPFTLHFHALFPVLGISFLQGLSQCLTPASSCVLSLH